MPFTIPRPTNPFSSALFLVYGFGSLIILGTVLLILPVSSASGQFTPLIDALFTATSAVTLTGLVVVDTGTHWSLCGQIVLLVLFQMGGFGFITGATLLLLAIRGKFRFKDRLLVAESAGVDQIGSVLGVVARIAVFSLLIEAFGAIACYFYWSATGAPETSPFTAIFHAVSAFNNCGFDIFGDFKSLVDYRSDILFLFITALLILSGSTGYILFADLAKKRSFTRLSLESKIVLTVTAFLLLLGTAFYLITESGNPATLGPLSLFQQIMAAFFQAVTPRTAGFTAVDIGSLHQLSLLFTMFLMFIGGASGSTAGGVKVNTLGILVIIILNVVRGKEKLEAFGRQLPRQTAYQAISLIAAYLSLAGIVLVVLSITETFPVENILFETLSALGTVGLSTGITPELSITGRIIIILAMFAGRLGPLTFITFLVNRKKQVEISYPHAKILLG